MHDSGHTCDVGMTANPTWRVTRHNMVIPPVVWHPQFAQVTFVSTGIQQNHGKQREVELTDSEQIIFNSIWLTKKAD